MTAFPADTSALAATLPGWHVEVFAEIDSTNRAAMGRREALPVPALLVARHQRQGRGRSGRGWLSPPGHSLAFSVLWRLPLPPESLNGLSLAMGVALLDGLRGSGFSGIGVKWPNDLIAPRGKLAGILVESARSGADSLVVVGVGLNLGHSTLLDGLDQPVATLAELPGPEPRPAADTLLTALVQALGAGLERFGRQGLAPFVEAWRSADVHRDRPVSLHHPDGRVEQGIARGIDGQGRLLLMQDGRLRPVAAGELRLRRAGECP